MNRYACKCFFSWAIHRFKLPQSMSSLQTGVTFCSRAAGNKTAAWGVAGVVEEGSKYNKGAGAGVEASSSL